MAALSRVSARRAPVVRALFGVAGLGIPKAPIKVETPV
jgi:hypothetical protein